MYVVMYIVSTEINVTESKIFGQYELIQPKLAGPAEYSDSVHLNYVPFELPKPSW